MSYTILTIDDSRVIRKIVKRALEAHDCTVFEGENGQEGLKVALKTLPDLIILDIDMPVMNGWDTLASIRFEKAISDTPVILLTANVGEKNINRAENLGVAQFLPKPFLAEALIRCVGNVLQF